MSDWRIALGLWWWQMGKRINLADITPKEMADDVAALGVPAGFAYDGRLMSRAQFLAHLKTLTPPTWIKTVTTHHTANPTEATWRQYGGWSYWGPNMANYYHNRLGWHAGPHAYISYEGIGLMTPVTQHGIHAGSVANGESLGAEIVGLFSTALPTGETLTNAAFAFAAMLWWAKLPITALRAHRQYLATQCPGNKLWANWSWWQGQVATQLAIIKAAEDVPPEPPPDTLEARVATLETKVAAHGRLIVELEQANRDRMADIAAVNQDIMSHGVALGNHEQRIATLEQAQRDLVAADEALNGDVVRMDESMAAFEQRIVAMEAILAQGGQQLADLTERIKALEEINTPGP